MSSDKIDEYLYGNEEIEPTEEDRYNDDLRAIMNQERQTFDEPE